MIKKSVYDKIHNGLTSGVYKTIRLVKKTQEGEQEILVPYNKVSEPEEATKRLEFIKMKIDKDLSPGKYEIQCKSAFNRGALEESYGFEVLKKVNLSPARTKSGDEYEDHTTDQENMSEVSIEDYLKEVRDNAYFKAQVDVLIIERDHYKKMYEELVKLRPNGLADGSQPPQENKSTLEAVMSVLSDALPTGLGLLQELMDQRSRKIALEENKQNPVKKVKKLNGTATKQNNEVKAIVEAMTQLFEEDPERFDLEMDQIEEQDPKLYDYLCKELGIEEDEEEEEEEEDEE